MKTGRARTLPLVLGAVAGAIVAVNLSGAPSPQPEVRAREWESESAQAASKAPPPEPPQGAPTNAPSSASPAVTPVDPPTFRQETAALARAFELVPPSTRDELDQVENRCARKVPEECERAALALDAGLILPRDARRAVKLRRMALTLYVKQCEADRAQACTRLAEMHEARELAGPNRANARALRRRVEELCLRHPTQPGCEAEP